MSMNIATPFTGSRLTPPTTQVKASNAQRSGNISTEADRLLQDLEILGSLQHLRQLQTEGKLLPLQVDTLGELEKTTFPWLKQILELPEAQREQAIQSHYQQLEPMSKRVIVKCNNFQTLL